MWNPRQDAGPLAAPSERPRVLVFLADANGLFHGTDLGQGVHLPLGYGILFPLFQRRSQLVLAFRPIDRSDNQREIANL